MNVQNEQIEVHACNSASAFRFEFVLATASKGCFVFLTPTSATWLAIHKRPQCSILRNKVLWSVMLECLASQASMLVSP